MTSLPRDPVDRSVPDQWAETVVLESVHCRQCGYDLRKLRADSRCPECGLLIWSSVQHTVDPTASRLPSIRNPRAVGNALVGLTTCMLGGMIVLMLPNVVRVMTGDARFAMRTWPQPLHTMAWIWTGLLVVLCLWAIRTLAPPKGAEPNLTVWKDIWRIAVGICGALIFGCLWVAFIDSPGLFGVRRRLALHLAVVAYATIGLIGMRGVLNVIGYRSREYRRSQGGRQNVELIIAALVAGLSGAFMYYLARMQYLPWVWTNLSRMVIWASHFMVLIGLAYLVVNAWWIRRSLRKPPPALDQVLAPNLPPDTWIPDREE